MFSIIRAAPGVDALRVIAHHHDVLMPRRQQVDQVALQLVRVLVFVHQDELEAPLVLLAHLLLLLHQLEPERQQIVEIHRVRRPLARRVTLLDVRNLRRQVREIVVLLLQNLRNRPCAC